MRQGDCGTVVLIKKEFLCWKIIKVHCAQGSAPIVPA